MSKDNKTREPNPDPLNLYTGNDRYYQPMNDEGSCGGLLLLAIGIVTTLLGMIANA